MSRDMIERTLNILISIREEIGQVPSELLDIEAIMKSDNCGCFLGHSWKRGVFEREHIELTPLWICRRAYFAEVDGYDLYKYFAIKIGITEDESMWLFADDIDFHLGEVESNYPYRQGRGLKAEFDRRISKIINAYRELLITGKREEVVPPEYRNAREA